MYESQETIKTDIFWGKVMFLLLCVILFTREGWLASVHHRSHDQGVCIRGMGVGQTPPSTMGYGQQAGGTHPTGMHSCFENVLMCRMYCMKHLGLL